jgi:hypothetical protein
MCILSCVFGACAGRGPVGGGAGPRQRCARDNANANYNALIYPFRVAKWRARPFTYNIYYYIILYEYTDFMCTNCVCTCV